MKTLCARDRSLPGIFATFAVMLVSVMLVSTPAISEGRGRIAPEAVFEVSDVRHDRFLWIFQRGVCTIEVRSSGLPEREHDIVFEISILLSGTEVGEKDRLVSRKDESGILVYRFPDKCDRIAKIELKNFVCVKDIILDYTFVECGVRFVGRGFER